MYVYQNTCVCVCVCTHVRACVRACVCACVHVCSVNLCDRVWENRPLCLDYELLVPH